MQTVTIRLKAALGGVVRLLRAHPQAVDGLVAAVTKLGLSTRAQAVVVAYETGLVVPGSGSGSGSSGGGSER